MAKKVLFFGRTFSIEIRTLSSIISLKCAEFLVLTGIAGLGNINRHKMSGWNELYELTTF